MFGRVSGRVDGSNADAAELDDVVVAEQAWGDGCVFEPARGPIVAALVGDAGDGADAVGELADAGEEVGVDVGFGGVGDAEFLSRGEFDVAVDVAFGVDDDGLARAGAADEVGGLREAFVVEHADEHGRFPWLAFRCRRCADMH